MLELNCERLSRSQVGREERRGIFLVVEIIWIKGRGEWSYTWFGWLEVGNEQWGCGVWVFDYYMFNFVVFIIVLV